MPESSERMRFVIDTDAANEIDDQFAIACGLSAERLEALVESSPPALGMQRRYEEIARVFDAAGVDPAGRICRGAADFLPSPSEPVGVEPVVDVRILEVYRVKRDELCRDLFARVGWTPGADEADTPARGRGAAPA